MARTDERSGGKLAAWDKVEKSDPYAIPGTRSYRPSRAAGGGGRFDVSDLVQLTPYTPSPVAPEPTTGREQAEDFIGQARAGALDLGLVWPSKEEEQAETEQKPRQTEALKTEQPKTRRSYEMSWEDYRNLSDEQRAAVDFNTLLVQAREKDLNTEYEATPEQREEYDRAVEQMFGERGGSQTFAPETLAVLQQIDFAANGETLDDFLSLKTTVSEKELKDFEIEPTDIPVEIDGGSVPLGPVVVGEAQAADKTAELQAAMARSNELLQTFKASAAVDRNDAVTAFGGVANKAKPAAGFGAPAPAGEEATIDDFFQWAFNDLTLKNADPQLTWNAIDETLTPKEKQAFVRYVDARSRQMADFDLDAGDGKRRSAEEIRSLIGLDKGAR